jgi:sialate O-acetylesterase
MRRITFVVLVAGHCISAAGAQPGTLLGELFRDHAVLQRERPIAVWGHAAPHEAVTVSLARSSVQARADGAGVWRATLPAMPAGGPFVLSARAASGAAMAASDVLLGDVFLCSGQSNMEFPMQRANAPNEIANSADDSIRLLNVAHAASPVPLASFKDPVQWQIAAPATVADFSAVCFFFARELRHTVHAPIGLIQAAWGGANIRTWISAAGLAGSAGHAQGLRLLQLYAHDQQQAQVQFAAQWEQWWRSRSGESAGAEPWSVTLRLEGNRDWHLAPAALGDWHGWRVRELEGFTGALWFRTHVALSAQQARGAVGLSLGAINQVDQTWINGRPLGNTFGFNAERYYQIPAGMLHAGDNLIVVNISSNYGVGGLLAGPTPRALHLESGATVPLNGEWRYRVVPASFGYPPRTPWDAVGGLTTLYNAMIAPLGPYGLHGALWYQGESNTDEAESYQALLSALMADWRRQFGAHLPYLVVQLPNYGPPAVRPAESGWANVREAQRRAVAIDPHAGLVVTIDIGEPRNLHPSDKQDVGARAARVARHVIYGEAISPSGPTPLDAARRGERVVVEFRDIEGALVAYSHDSPIGFELCADSAGSCRFAQSRIDGAGVSLQIPDGLSPTRVRYCWADSPVCTLFDASGLPAGPFELTIGAPGRVVSPAAVTALPTAANALPPVHLSSEEDHERTLRLLNIITLRPGPDGDPASPRAANFDEAKVGAYGKLPDPLVLKSGEKVTSPHSWWHERRPEIVADFDREIYGRVPKTVPFVRWRVAHTSRESEAGVAVVKKAIVGHVDNASYPPINVDIELSLTTPAGARRPVPVIMEFGLAAQELAALRQRLTGAQWAAVSSGATAWHGLVLARGWGYATLVATSIQPDSGAGLTQGVIGLANRGQPRQLEDWGALRAWAWGASRALDYLETDSSVDATHVGIEGLSRYGKAALVAMAYDPRFAIAFVGSSGEGGAKILRRHFGEQVENVASTAEYHWMAGNFLKYAGPLTASDLPVDAHELLALCAPRPVFVSSGSQQVEGGWVDARGMFLAAVAAGPVY